MKILSSNFIKTFQYKIINIHPSLLPKYKGMNTFQRILKNKDKISGCTVHYVNNKLDSGKIINRKTLKFFPKESVIVNSARGDMVDDDAMVEALKNKSIFALGLDVYNGEPKIHSGYLNHPNVFILPHLGSSTIKTRTDMADLAINNIEEFFKKGDCINRVN